MRMIRYGAGAMLACALGLASASKAAGSGAAGEARDDPCQRPKAAFGRRVQKRAGPEGNSRGRIHGYDGVSVAASLSLNCTDCHISESASSWARYADDTPIKETARKMIFMVNTINKSNFGGSKFVTCWTCHRGNQRPTVIPSLLEQYSAPPPDDPNEVTVNAEAYQGPTAEQILDKYLKALGGPEKVAGMTSFTGKGHSGRDTTRTLKKCRSMCTARRRRSARRWCT